MKANHNLEYCKSFWCRLLSIHQRYKMKANHNESIKLLYERVAVINTSKIQNESKSQLISTTIFLSICCYQYIKDTK